MPPTKQRDIDQIWVAIDKQNVDIATQSGDIKELRTALIGIDGHNGLRGELREFILEMRRRDERQDAGIEKAEQYREALEEKVDEAIRYSHKVWEVDRFLPGGCLGVKALEEHLDELEAKEKALAEAELQKAERDKLLVLELRKARIASRGTTIAAIVAALGAVAVAVISKVV